MTLHRVDTLLSFHIWEYPANLAPSKKDVQTHGMNFHLEYYKEREGRKKCYPLEIAMLWHCNCVLSDDALRMQMSASGAW